MKWKLVPGRKLIVILALFLVRFTSAEAAADAGLCPRPAGGSTITSPVEISASNRSLHIALAFRSQVDDDGHVRFCYIDDRGVENPTLRVWPGDKIVLDLKNESIPPASPPALLHPHAANSCSAGPMTSSSTNLHFHGLAIPPLCHQDDVIHTLIQPSQPAFQYSFRIPADQPPGLYWYHPHPHGFSEDQVLGGASGALIIEGIARSKPQVAGLPERVLILRDQLVAGGKYKRKSSSADDDDQSEKDISLNFVPMMYPLYRPAVMRVPPDRREFWRVLNASADTYFTLQVISVDNGQRVPRKLQLIAIDGAAASDTVTAEPRTEILVSPGSRAEFILTTPHAGAFSQLVSRSYDTGPDGAANSGRVIANILSDGPDPQKESPGSAPSERAAGWHFTGLDHLHPVRARKLFFSEDRADLRTPGEPPKYFITVEGREPALFDMNFKAPDIIVQQGTVEDWIVENRAREAHVFHIHQLHFQLLARDAIEAVEPMLRDTIDLPYWDGKSAYPSVRLRMDFRAPEIVGTFLFHCHILEHEDAGMMGSVEVVKAR